MIFIMGIIGGIASAAAAAGTQLGGSALQYALMKKEAQRQRDWQERMSSTAMRRRVKDLRAAG